MYNFITILNVKKFREIIAHPLISGSSILLIGGFVMNFLGYLFNLVMGRLLPVPEYGLLATLTSLIVLFGIFQNSFVGIFAKFAATYKAKKNPEALSQLISQGTKFTFLFTFSLMIILIVSSQFIAQLIKVDNVWSLIFIFLATGASILYALPVGILKGEMRFYSIAILNTISPILKIILGVSAVLLGFQVLGVTIGIFLSAAIPVLLGIVLIKRGLVRVNRKAKYSPDILHQFTSYGLKFFLATLGLTVISNADIVLVRYFFTPEISGQFAALSLMGKAIFYITTPVYSVFFPLIVQKTEKKENVQRTLLFAIGLIVSISLGLSFVYFLAPNFVLSIFFPSSEYSVLAEFLGPFSLYIALFSVAFLFNNYFLSAGKIKIYKINLAFAVLFVILFSIFHNSLYQVIGVLFVSTFLLLLSYLIYYYRIYNGGN